MENRDYVITSDDLGSNESRLYNSRVVAALLMIIPNLYDLSIFEDD